MVAYLFIPDAAMAQIPDNAAETILTPFRLVRVDHIEQVRDLATTLFLSLLTIEFVTSACMLIWNGADLYSFGRWLTERILIGGIMIYVFIYGPRIGSEIQVSLNVISASAGGVNTDPSDVMELGIAIAAKLTGDISFWDGAKALPIMLAALVLSALFALIAANLVVVLAELYLVSTIGIFLLGFAGGSWTRSYAWGYFKWLLAVCFKVAIMQLLVGEGLNIVQGWIDTIANNNADVANVGMMTILSTVLIIYTLSSTLPTAAASMISGHVGGGIGNVAQTASQMNSSAKSAASAVTSGAKAAGVAAVKIGSAANAVANSSFGASTGSLDAKTQSGAAGNAGSSRGGSAAKGPSSARRA